MTAGRTRLLSTEDRLYRATGREKGKGNKGHIGSGSNNLPLGHPKSRPRPKSSAAGADGPDGSGPAEDEAAADGEGEGRGEGEGAGKTVAPERSSHVTSLASAYPPAPTSPAGPSLPPKPPARTPGADSQAWELRRGVRLAGGDVAYYDASFVEDPWRALR